MLVYGNTDNPIKNNETQHTRCVLANVSHPFAQVAGENEVPGEGVGKCCVKV